MKPSEASDVRTFFEHGVDAQHAFRYRLHRAVEAIRRASPDYGSLAESLSQIPPGRAGTIVSQERGELLVLARSNGISSRLRVVFFQQIHEVARSTGDSELAAWAACTYVREASISWVLTSGAYLAGRRILARYREETSLSCITRAEVAFTLAEVAMAFGRLSEAIMQARRAQQLDRSSERMAKCFVIAGDIDAMRGMYRQAVDKYSRAMRLTGGLDEALKVGSRAPRRWAMAKIQTGQIVLAWPVVEKLLSGGKDQGDEGGVDRALLALMLEREMGEGPAVRMIVRLQKVFSGLLERWRDACTLSLSAASHFVSLGRCGSAHKHLAFAMRMAEQQGNRTDMGTAFLCAAQACWMEGRLTEALASVRVVRRMLYGQRPGALIGHTDIIRSRIAFFRGDIRKAISLAMKANETCVKAGASYEALDAVRTIAAVSIWLEKPEDAVRMLSDAAKLREAQLSVDGIMADYGVLVSGHLAIDRVADAEKWRDKAHKLSRVRTKPLSRLRLFLLESEWHWGCGRHDECLREAKKALAGAKMLKHKILEGISRYQILKGLIAGGRLGDAEKQTSLAERLLPFANRVMWQHARKVIANPDRARTKLKPLGAFPT